MKWDLVEIWQKKSERSDINNSQHLTHLNNVLHGSNTVSVVLASHFSLGISKKAGTIALISLLFLAIQHFRIWKQISQLMACWLCGLFFKGPGSTVTKLTFCPNGPFLKSDIEYMHLWISLYITPSATPVLHYILRYSDFYFWVIQVKLVKQRKSFQSQRVVLILATGIPWFWNLSLSCLWLGYWDEETEVGSLWLRNGATLCLWCWAIQQSFVVWAMAVQYTLIVYVYPKVLCSSGQSHALRFTSDNRSKMFCQIGCSANSL